MKYIRLFEDFNNEPMKGEYMIEEFVDTNFIKTLTGKSVLMRNRDYDILESEKDLMSNTYNFRLVVFNINTKYHDQLEDNYQIFSKPFVDFVQSNGYTMPVINSESDFSMVFQFQSK